MSFSRLTALLGIVVKVAIAIRCDIRKAGARGGGDGGIVRERLSGRKGGDVVVIDARSAWVKARETAVLGIAAGELRGADAGALAAVATVVTC